MPIIQFSPFSSVVSPAFWHKLTELKIDVLRLSDAPLTISGTYTAGRSIVDRETGQEVVLPCSFGVEGESFEVSGVTGVGVGTGGVGGVSVGEGGGRRKGTVKVQGTFKNFNTIEEFKSSDKTALFNEEAQKVRLHLSLHLFPALPPHNQPITNQSLTNTYATRQIWTSILTTKSTKELTRFFLISFADLKKYKYYYWFGFPAFVAKPAWEIGSEGWKSAKERFSADQLSSIDAQIKDRPFFLVAGTPNGDYTVGNVEDYETFFKGVATENRIIGFIDPSADPANPGWPLRNLLAYLRALHPESTSELTVLRWRDTQNSKLGVVTLNVEGTSNATPSVDERPSAVGWERNPQGKLGARLADLGPMMDPTRLAAQAVDLNLKLMRWRILPQLDLEKVRDTKCLLLGAGTLGCYVARGLMAWGVRNITLLDSSRVSFSNPVRQPLFTFEDCLDGGRPKAECAAERLKAIFPGVNARGVALSIPMPGHPVGAGSVEQVKADVAKLEQLIEEHDAVFLLMDSRESRWLPTVIGASKGKSLTDRTLDQMCTVTRPGLAPIAAATAVELLTSVLQHPDGIHAQPPPPSSAGGAGDFLPTSSYAEQGGSVLGMVPHQIRGFLAQFRNLQLVGSGYERCVGCSEAILQAYESQGFAMLLKAFNEDKYLEKLSGLDKLAEEGEAVLEAVDWEEDGGDDF
ncbi:autophagy protein 7 [Coprinopsis cinerea okayama7|uniref:Autophagy protein 7 n=1 Tax=Coprinopsis cinerea (strain Okayama-7 / 130 / ATCC MYA-4618 / FGSC 9003) TaxID=240176 RepID=A8PEG6_COPC7|nr:autophagy protein 7 [Coprinopsis cinerea okayama7\|eukprot:XP_001840791.2 autophagy protein 7 [Coprinopsis cinerea okayama7\